MRNARLKSGSRGQLSDKQVGPRIMNELGNEAHKPGQEIT